MAVRKRTDRSITLYQPRGPRTNYDGVFPWSVNEHWRRIKAAPSRAARKIEAKLSGESTSQSIDIRLRYPEFVQTRTELTHVRRALETLFSGDARTRLQQREQAWAGCLAFSIISSRRT